MRRTTRFCCRHPPHEKRRSLANGAAPFPLYWPGLGMMAKAPLVGSEYANPPCYATLSSHPADASISSHSCIESKRGCGLHEAHYMHPATLTYLSFSLLQPLAFPLVLHNPCFAPAFAAHSNVTYLWCSSGRIASARSTQTQSFVLFGTSPKLAYKSACRRTAPPAVVPSHCKVRSQDLTFVRLSPIACVSVFWYDLCCSAQSF